MKGIAMLAVLMLGFFCSTRASAFSLSEMVRDELGGFVEDLALIYGTSQWNKRPFAVAALGVACLREPRQLVAFFATTKNDSQEVIHSRWLHSEVDYDLVVLLQRAKVSLVGGADFLIEAIQEDDNVKLTFVFDGKTATTRHKIIDKKRVAFSRVRETCRRWR